MMFPGMSDGMFFLTIFFFLFIAWVAGGGPSHPSSFTGPFVAPITTGITASNFGGADQTQSSISEYNQQLSDLQKQANRDRLFGTPSAFKGQVRIGGGNAQSTDPAQQYVDVFNSSQSPVSLSGWKLQDVTTGRTVTIPAADPLPGNGTASAQSPVVLAPGQGAHIVTGSSPFGASFRDNECLGYLQSAKRLVPAVQQRCPSPAEEFQRFYTGNSYQDRGCYAEMTQLSGCQTPPTPTGLSQSCYAFIDQHLNYNGCVVAHQSDPNFAGQAWYVYLDYHDPNAKNHSINQPLWRSDRDAIKLLDQNGNTVDMYQY